MASKNPIGRLADTAINTLKNPLDTAGMVVEQAKGTAALGKMVAEQVGKSAVTKATGTAGAVLGVVTGRRPTKTETYAPEGGLDAPLRPVPDVNEPAHTPAPGTASTRPTPAQRAARPVKKAAETVEKAADTVEKAAAAVEKSAATKQTGKKAPSAPAAKKAAPAKTAPAKTAAAKKAPAKKASTKRAPAVKVTATPADVAEVVESAVAEDPSTTAATKATTPAKKAAAKKVTRKAPAKKSSPGARLPKKATGTGDSPRSAEQLATLEGTDVVSTPVGTPAADSGTNPDTAEKGLNQPGTEGIVESSTANEVASKSEILRKAAERNPE